MMSYLPKNLPQDQGALKLTAQLHELDQIHCAETAAVLCERELQGEILDWLAALAPEQLPQARLILAAHEVEHVLQQLCDQSGMPLGQMRNAWIKDVAHLAKIFSEVMVSPTIQLRLDIVTTDACRKFHRDFLTARMVCTYRGRATQYGFAEPKDVPSEIFNVPTGALFMMRGDKWPSHPKTSLLHRSPPIAGTGETRLLLVLDPIEEE